MERDFRPLQHRQQLGFIGMQPRQQAIHQDGDDQRCDGDDEPFQFASSVFQVAIATVWRSLSSTGGASPRGAPAT